MVRRVSTVLDDSKWSIFADENLHGVMITGEQPNSIGSFWVDTLAPTSVGVKSPRTAAGRLDAPRNVCS